MREEGLTERGFTEVLAITDHVAGLSTAVEGLGVKPDMREPAEGREAALVMLPAESQAPDRVAAVFAEIRAWARERLGIDRVPNAWRALALRPHYLEATWRKDQLVRTPGELSATTKAAVALAVAMFGGGRYWIEYEMAAFRSLGFDDAAVVEVAGLVNHYVSYNTVAHGMQLDAVPLPPEVAAGIGQRVGAGAVR